MARPIGTQACLSFELLKLALAFPYSTENGAFNRSQGEFRFCSQLKLALSLSLKQKLRHNISKIVEKQTLRMELII
jgi:hypothetical protein